MGVGTSGFHQRLAFGLFGAGGCARGVMPLLLDGGAGVALSREDGSAQGTACFVERDPATATLNSVKILSEAQFFELTDREQIFNVAIADSRLREKIAGNCLQRGVQARSIRSKHCVTYDAVQIGEGAILCANTMITSNVTIGRFFHLNIFGYVEHDCVIGDFVTFAPGVHCNGNVHIGDHAYIGSGAIIRHGSPGKPMVIGAGAVVGMGAVVISDVAPNTTVVGNPAKPLDKSSGTRGATCRPAA